MAGSQQKSTDDLYHEAILGDTSHPLNSEFEMLPSGRRYRAPQEPLFLEQYGVCNCYTTVNSLLLLLLFIAVVVLCLYLFW